MKYFRGINKRSFLTILCLMAIFSVGIIMSVKIVRAQLARATFTSESSYNNPFALGNGESVPVKIRWNKDVSGFELDDLDYRVIDHDGNSITNRLRHDNAIRLPELSNFEKLSPKLYKVSLKAPQQHYGFLQSGELLLSFAYRNNEVIGEPFEHDTLNFSWGKKATGWVYPERRYLAHAESMRIAIIWDRNVSGVNLDDLSSDVGQVSHLHGNGSFMEAKVTAPEQGSGKIQVTLREDACAAGNNSASMYVAYGPPR